MMLGRKATIQTLLGILLFSAPFGLTACLEGSSSSQATGEITQPSMTDPTSECVTGEVRAKKQNGEFQTFLSIQDAVNASSSGWSLYVGPGKWDELVQIPSKKNLVLRSNCKAQIKGVKISFSQDVTIQGFNIDAKSSGADGVRIEGGSGIRIEENYIHSSLLNGIYFDAHTDEEVSGPIKAGPHYVVRSIIYSNTLNGILVDGKQTINLDGNRIIGNGMGTDQKDGYGLKIANSENEEYIKLTSNIIAYNDGKPSPNKATKDIYGIKKIFDSSDFANQTTSGTESPTGVSQFIDTKAPIIKLSVSDPIYTSNPAFTIAVTIDDEAPITTKVFQNGLLISTQKNFVFEVSATLKDDNNTFKFESTDAAGNKTTSNLNQIVLDRVVPIIKIFDNASKSSADLKTYSD